jgi:hypothetical protein
MALGVLHINKALTGGTDRFTTDTTIWARWFAVQLSNGAAGTLAYVGDSSCAGATTCTFEAGKGLITPVTGSGFEDIKVGNQYRLSDWYVKGTANDNFTIMYEVVSG